jgi:hypothetical protein
MASAYMDVVESWACPDNCCSVFSGTPQLIALMPKPCRSPFGVACGPAIFAAFHDSTNDIPALCPAPVPQPHRLASIPALVCRADVMNKVQHVEKRRRNRDWTIYSRLSLLCTFDYDGAVLSGRYDRPSVPGPLKSGIRYRRAWHRTFAPHALRRRQPPSGRHPVRPASGTCDVRVGREESSCLPISAAFASRDCPNRLL